MKNQIATIHPPLLGKHESLTERAKKVIHQRNGEINIRQLSMCLLVSTRTLQRWFKLKEGISPKRYSRKVRIKGALARKRQNPGMTWTKVCYRSGYFDQMHFIKEFKEFLGTTPTKYSF